MYTLTDFTTSLEDSCREALCRIDNNSRGFLVVVDREGSVLGTLTDGDIRRFITSGGNLDDTIGEQGSYNASCTLLDASGTLLDAVELFKSKKTNFLPIVGAGKVLKSIITKSQFKTLMLRGEYPDLDYDFLNVDESLSDHELFLRPWGIYKTTILQGAYQGKVLHLFPDSAISLQYHKRREEHWVVVAGQGVAFVGESRIPIETGSHIFIPKRCLHRLVNTSTDEPLIVSETQIGDYLGEDDIFRIEDKYGRVSSDESSLESDGLLAYDRFLSVHDCNPSATEAFDFSQVKLFLTDCDGCLTDGGMYYSTQGECAKRFSTRDGMGLRLLREAGIKIGIVTGEDSPAVFQRAKKLKVDVYEPGCEDKLETVRRLCAETGVLPGEIVYVGDDVNDLCLSSFVGLFCSPCDAQEEVRSLAGYVAQRAGGHGAIREIADMILTGIRKVK